MSLNLAPTVPQTPDHTPVVGASSTVNLHPILTWLVEQGDLESLSAAEINEAAGGDVGELARLLKGSVSTADIHEAAARAKTPLPVVRLADLPDWNVVLNDAQERLGESVRNPKLAIIANDQEAGRTQLRCFIVHTPDTGKAELTAAVTKVIAADLHLAGRIEAPEEVIGVLYGRWDERGRRRLRGDAADPELHAEFDRICEEAIALRASDIHIVSNGSTGAIYLRVDGKLEHYQELPADHALALCTSAYNTLTDASSVNDSFNPNKPQDSAIERHLKVGRYRFRFSSLPTAPSGFDVTLRPMPIGAMRRRLTPTELGFSKDQERLLERLMSRSAGMLLFAGTTGAGKSTSMANLLQKLAEDWPGKKIRTVEEPVELLIPGVSQHPVTRKSDDGHEFKVVLRQLMRSDPDVVMIGEIRDGDTAHVAIQIVRSGHFCISTVHAHGAPLCFDRLGGMGVDRRDLASVNLIAGLVYQKLLPLLCPSCKIEASSLDLAELPHDAVERLKRVKAVNGGTLSGIFLRRPGGCPHCSQRGAMGRTVCAEILQPTLDMLPAIAAGDSREVWRQWRATINHADPADMTGRTAFEHALWKMRQGLVSPVDLEAEFHYLDEAPFEGGAS
jgi:Type II secretory pathway, ATPase PulE/Tfp pilus assembly pathway, ATPase PilB